MFGKPGELWRFEGGSERQVICLDHHGLAFTNVRQLQARTLSGQNFMRFVRKIDFMAHQERRAVSDAIGRARSAGPSGPGAEARSGVLSPRDVVRFAFEADSLAAWSYIPASGVTSWCAALPVLFGLAENAPPSLEALRARIAPEDLPKFDNVVARLHSSAETVRTWLRIERPDGTRSALTLIIRSTAGADGQIVRISGGMREASSVFDRLVSERAHAHALQQIVNGSLAFQGLLSHDGILVEVNDTALLASGLKRKEVIGQHIAETQWWTHDRAVADRLKEALERAAGGVPVRYDEQVRIHDGSLIWIDFLISPVIEEAGAVVGFVVSALDVTKRYRVLAEREIVSRELEHRNRNILSVVSAIVEVTPAETADEFRAALHTSLEALGAAQSLLVANGPATVSLRDVLDGVLVHLTHARGDLLQLEGPDITVSADAARAMSMIAHELAANALKHADLTRNVGRITVFWTRDPGGTFAFTWFEHDNCSQGEITRRGLGSTIIETISRQILGGDCARRFSPEGMSWVLRCPLDRIMAETPARDARNAPASPAQPAAYGSPARGSVLIVEDEPLQAMVMAQTLTRAGYRVMGPANSLKAAEALLAVERPDLALLDINLGGGETSAALARRLDAQGVPVVVLSLIVEGGRDSGMPHVLALPKPLRPKRLLEALETLLPAR